MTAPFNNPARIIDLHHQGLSHRQIAQQLGCHHRTVQRHLEVNRKAREEGEREAVRGWLEEKRREGGERSAAERAFGPCIEGKTALAEPVGQTAKSAGSSDLLMKGLTAAERDAVPIFDAHEITYTRLNPGPYSATITGTGMAPQVVTVHADGSTTSEVLDTSNPRSGRWFRRAP